VVGIMYHMRFSAIAHGTVASDNHRSAIWSTFWRVGGEDTPALGSDWDGSIITPRDNAHLPGAAHASWRRCSPATSPSA